MAEAKAKADKEEKKEEASAAQDKAEDLQKEVHITFTATL